MTQNSQNVEFYYQKQKQQQQQQNQTNKKNEFFKNHFDKGLMQFYKSFL